MSSDSGNPEHEHLDRQAFPVDVAVAVAVRADWV